MKKENGYEVIKEKLQERLDGCRKYLRDISTETVLNKSLKEIQDLKDFCDDEYKTMTAILMVDLYHIIGMVDLTTRQIQEFHKMMKEYASYRPNLEEVKETLKTITDLPKVPRKTRFALIGLKGITLVSGPADAEEVEEFCDIGDYKSIRKGSVAQSTIDKNKAKQEAVGDSKEIADKADKASAVMEILGSTEPDVEVAGDYRTWTIHDTSADFNLACRIFFKLQNPKQDYIDMSDEWFNSCSKKIRSCQGYGLTWHSIPGGGWKVTYRKSINKTLDKYVEEYRAIVKEFN